VDIAGVGSPIVDIARVGSPVGDSLVVARGRHQVGTGLAGGIAKQGNRVVEADTVVKDTLVVARDRHQVGTDLAGGIAKEGTRVVEAVVGTTVEASPAARGRH
jgi:hypothetical protein